MRTKHARIVDKLVTENTIAQNNATSPPTSSAVSVVTQATWLEIALTGMLIIDTLERGKC